MSEDNHLRIELQLPQNDKEEEIYRADDNANQTCDQSKPEVPEPSPLFEVSVVGEAPSPRVSDPQENDDNKEPPNSEDKTQAINEDTLTSAADEVLSEPVDPAQLYLDGLAVHYEEFENYEETEKQETMREINVTQKSRYCLIVCLVLGIFCPPFLLVGLIREYRYRRSPRLASLYYLIMFMLFFDALVLAAVIFVVIVYLSKALM